MKKFLLFILPLFLMFPKTGTPYSLGEYDIAYFCNTHFGYDSNITTDYTDKKSDSLFSLGASVNVQSIRKLQLISLKGTLTHQRFVSESQFNNTAEKIDLDFFKELSKYARIRIEDNFSHSYDPISFADSFGKQEGHDSHYQNHLTTTYMKDITKQLNYLVIFFNEWDSVENQTSDDSFFNELTFTGHYAIDSANIILLSYVLGQRKFDAGDSATRTNVSSGIRKYIADNLYYDVAGGLDFISPYSGENSLKPLFMASLTGETRKTSSLKLELIKRQLLQASVKDVLSSWRISITATAPLNEKFSTNISCFYGDGDFISQNVSEQLTGFNARLNCILKEKLTGRLTYYYANVDSNEQTREYTRSKLLLSFLWEL